MTKRESYINWLSEVKENEHGEICLSGQAVKDIVELLQESLWIPCSEWLPEDEEDVLVTRHFLSDKQLKKDAITESFYVEVASLMSDEWSSYSDDYKIKRHLHKVIAWMPLPEHWRGEEDG